MNKQEERIEHEKKIEDVKAYVANKIKKESVDGLSQRIVWHKEIKNNLYRLVNEIHNFYQVDDESYFKFFLSLLWSKKRREKLKELFDEIGEMKHNASHLLWDYGLVEIDWIDNNTADDSRLRWSVIQKTNDDKHAWEFVSDDLFSAQEVQGWNMEWDKRYGNGCQENKIDDMYVKVDDFYKLSTDEYKSIANGKVLPTIEEYYDSM